MLLPSEIDNITEYINKYFVALEDDLVNEITDRLASFDEMNIVALNDYNVLNQIGLLNNQINKKLAVATDKTTSEISSIVTKSMITSFKRDNIIFSQELPKDKLKISESLMQTLRADVNRINYDIRNLTGTTASTTQTEFYNALNLAHLEVVSGSKSYTQAMIDAIDKVAESGVDVLYPSGHKDKLEVATRRAIVTSVNQTNGSLQLQRCRELEWGLVEVSAHIGARPTHAEWQGKVFSLNGNRGKYKDFYKETGYGTLLGLCGVNCGHTFFPYYEGSSTAYDLKELEEINNKKVNYKGKNISYYEATQYQRSLERNIRKCNRQIRGNEKLLTNSDIDVDSVKYSITRIQEKEKALKKELKDFSDTVGLKSNNRLYGVGAEVKLLKRPNIKNTLYTDVKKDAIIKEEVTKLKKYNASTLQEAKNDLSNFANYINDNISRIKSIDALNIVSNTLEELNSKYNIGKLRSIGGYSSKKSNARANGRVLELSSNKFSSLTSPRDVYDEKFKTALQISIDRYEKWKKELEDNLEKYKNDYYMTRRIKEDIKDYDKKIKEFSETLKYDRWSLSSSYANEESLKITVIHEYGHIVADQFVGLRNGSMCTKNGIYTNEMRSLNAEISNAFREAKENGDIYKISQYANSNVHEFFAESFAMYNAENDKLPNYIKDVIEKVVNYGKSM